MSGINFPVEAHIFLFIAVSSLALAKLRNKLNKTNLTERRKLLIVIANFYVTSKKKLDLIVKTERE
jgi:hypothetical protein